MLIRKILGGATLIAFALSGSACSNGASVPHAAIAQQVPFAHGAMRRPNHVVEGVIKTDIWAVPEKETWSVGSKGLIVYAKRILIDGVLRVDSGTQIALFAPYLRINGSIASATKPGGLRGNKSFAVDVIDACDFRAGSVDSVDQPTIALPPGDSLYLVANTTDCDFTIYGFVSTADGRKGNLAFPLRRGGEDGGDIEVGTYDAIGVAASIARNIGETHASAHRPNTLTVAGKFVAGAGGNGADDLDGKFNSKTDVWTFAPTGGGDGGSIQFEPYTLGSTPLGSFDATAGRGGDGGGIGTANLDGTPEKHDAGELVIMEAGGALGGSVEILSNAKGHPTTSNGGLGGNAGSVSAAAGDGWSTAAGDGGMMRVTLAAPGKGGRNVTNVPALDGVYPTTVFSGGNGGSGAPFYGGGLAGSLYLTRPRGAPAIAAASITVKGFNGGPGGSACGGPGPTGGAGGNFYDTAPKSDLAAISLVGAFSGGTGGAGAEGTSGSGGFAGNFYLNGVKLQAIGSVGNPGRTC